MSIACSVVYCLVLSYPCISGTVVGCARLCVHLYCDRAASCVSAGVVPVAHDFWVWLCMREPREGAREG